jgi:hypothetical protein
MSLYKKWCKITSGISTTHKIFIDENPPCVGCIWLRQSKTSWNCRSPYDRWNIMPNSPVQTSLLRVHGTIPSHVQKLNQWDQDHSTFINFVSHIHSCKHAYCWSNLLNKRFSQSHQLWKCSKQKLIVLDTLCKWFCACRRPLKSEGEIPDSIRSLVVVKQSK